MHARSDAIIATYNYYINPRLLRKNQMEISIQLELNEVNAVLDAIGALPTSTNTWPIAAKIRAQAALQLPKEPGDVGETNTAD